MKHLGRISNDFNSIIEAAPCGMLVIDDQLKISQVNESICKLFGWTKTDLIGEKIEALLPAAFAWPEMHRLAIGNNDIGASVIGEGVEYRALHKDGSQFYVEIGLNLYQSQERNYLIASVVDLTQRREAESAMRHYSAIVETTRDAIIGKTLEGIITAWNHGAETLYGYSSGEIIGQSFSRLLPPERKEEFQEILSKIGKGEFTSEYESEHLRKNGDRIHVSLTVSPILDSEGHIVGASAIGRDIGERLNMKESQSVLIRKLATANEALVAINQELNQFAYIISHDLREPLRSVSNFMGLLKMDYADGLNEEANEYIDYAIKGTRRLENMIKSLLDYSRVNSNEGKWKLFQLNQAAKTAIAGLNAQVTDTKAFINIPTQDFQVRGDRNQIIQVFENLISNALKFSRPEATPQIEISYEIRKGRLLAVPLVEDKDYCLITISDNGIGIEEAFREQIFKIFQRLHSASEYKGNGIGLSICQKILKLHGGAIWVDSQPNKGSSFTFALPAVED